VASVLRRILSAIIEQGVTPALPVTLQKRIRLANGLSVFTAVLMLASIPFDAAEGPRVFVVEDLVGGFAYLMFPLLNRRGYVTASRVLAMVLSNLLVLVNSALVGRESGAPIVFVALVAVPFTLFDLQERWPLIGSVAFAILCFWISNLDGLTRFRQVPPEFSNADYMLYAGAVTIAVLLFSMGQTSRANARVERALRADIDERERAERELALSRQSAIFSAKMAALGEMSGNIAHEVNNPLAAILLRAEQLNRLAREGKVDAEIVARASRNIETTVHRIRGIVDALRAFARDVERDPMRPESVRQIVTDTLELCSKRFQLRAISIDVSPIPDDLRVVCRAVQISQILLNLLGNAYDAVETQERRRVRIGVEHDADQVWISVMDSGPGIPSELRARIMEPFFTTKDVGQGTGLGLSVSRGIADLHGGDLSLDPTSVETRFVLTLPRAPPS
jgi:signal transduction histidine kinase